MITNQVIQNSIDELSAITKVELGVYDVSGNICARTEGMNPIDKKIINDFFLSSADSQVTGKKHLLKISDEGEVLYILAAVGNSDDVYMVGKIAVSQLQGLILAYKEKYDRNNFIQNLLLDNLLLTDIYNRAKKLHIDVNTTRAVYLIETRIDRDPAVTELLKSMFTSQSGDYVTAVDESKVVLVKKMSPEWTKDDLKKIAETIADMINTEAMLNVRVAYGNPVSELKCLSKSYKEAGMALDVGKIFYEDSNVLSYGSLGIGRLIYQLPVNLCRMFIDEVFTNGIPEELDDETLNTLEKFFENNLNVSETSRLAFVHRNTLVYRLEKIKESVGLNVRNFNDALTFKIAMMVVKYVKYIEDNERDL
ncbi:MAG: helix-turn-helix domain-containing protein [Lachnospiraceae bacterium]|nr:helix-turn-helix domain-containing protein [Lachnospiraceae bacterium]